MSDMPEVTLAEIVDTAGRQTLPTEPLVCRCPFTGMGLINEGMCQDGFPAYQHDYYSQY